MNGFTVKIYRHNNELGPDGEVRTSRSQSYYACDYVTICESDVSENYPDWYIYKHITGYNAQGNIVCETAIYCIKHDKLDAYNQEVGRFTDSVIIENANGKTTEVIRTAVYGLVSAK